MSIDHSDPLRPIKNQLRRTGLDVHPLTVKRAIARGELATVRTGGGGAPHLVRDSVFDDWLRSRTRGGHQASAA